MITSSRWDGSMSWDESMYKSSIKRETYSYSWATSISATSFGTISWSRSWVRERAGYKSWCWSIGR